VPCSADQLDALLSKEWLIANKIGAYASSSVVGANTRRYHGLLVAATAPPVGREVALSTVMEQVLIGGRMFELATNEFSGAFSPRGFSLLAEFRNDVAPTWLWRFENVEIHKEIVLAETSNAVAIRYTLHGPPGVPVELRLWPFAALRDFHTLRKVEAPHQMTFETIPGGVAVQDRLRQGHALHVASQEAAFTARPQWWHRFHYRTDIARGQDGQEDLYTPGVFSYQLADGQSCQLNAGMGEHVPLGFATTLDRRRGRLETLASSVPTRGDMLTRRLAVATDAFVVQRSFASAAPSATIMAGYHWFADWGRDTFISLPGLLLATGRFDLARQVFSTFAAHISSGLVPNRFDDYLPIAHYNSIDASLWFIIAADRYVTASGDQQFWRHTLGPAAKSILTGYQEGTMFDIRADADGLLSGGWAQTQLTWMDAKLGNEVITPRHGKAVEVNALWHAAHQLVARRSADTDPQWARRCQERADIIGPAFVKAFWWEEGGYLCDCILDGHCDTSLRPNQVLAVSLPHCPLDPRQQKSVVQHIREQLLTPVGLRTLSPFDSRYRRAYGGSWESRDRAYHQGTVWAWLMGPFIEAYLKVENFKPFALAQAAQWLAPLEKHLEQAGLGFISEIFDGDPPHEPKGCIAQAWSVAEVLRVKLLLASLEAG
jgi:predicted glycogen debranching enzyme